MFSENQQVKLRKRTSNPHNSLPIMNNPNTFKVDGQDHINIWEKGQTKLGQFLSHGSHSPFHHPVLGMFNNVESFWHYIRSQERDDRIRTMNNIGAKKFSTQLHTVKVPNFYAIIMDTNYIKLKEYPEMLTLFKENELPLEMYFIYKDKGVRIRPSFAVWVLEGFKEIKKALNEDREPDFTFLLEKPTDDLYSFFTNQ